MVAVFVLFLLVVSPEFALGEEQTVEQQIADAVTPLPASLRAGATVVLTAEPGKRTVLREGTNAMICQADPPAAGFAVSCYHKAIDPLSSRIFELIVAGKSNPEIAETVGAEVKAGKFQVDAGRAVYAAFGSNRTDGRVAMWRGGLV